MVPPMGPLIGSRGFDITQDSIRYHIPSVPQHLWVNRAQGSYSTEVYCLSLGPYLWPSKHYSFRMWLFYLWKGLAVFANDGYWPLTAGSYQIFNSPFIYHFTGTPAYQFVIWSGNWKYMILDLLFILLIRIYFIPKIPFWGLSRSRRFR